MSYYRVGLDLDDLPGIAYLRDKIRDEAETGAKRGVELEIPRIRREVKQEATRAIRPLVIASLGFSIVSLLIVLIKR